MDCMTLLVWDMERTIQGRRYTNARYPLLTDAHAFVGRRVMSVRREIFCQTSYDDRQGRRLHQDHEASRNPVLQLWEVLSSKRREHIIPINRLVHFKNDTRNKRLTSESAQWSNKIEVIHEIARASLMNKYFQIETKLFNAIYLL